MSEKGSKKRLLTILALKPSKTPAAKKLKIKRKTNLISSWKSKVRLEQRQNTTKQQEREQSDYLYVENKHRQVSHVARPRKLKVHTPLVITPLAMTVAPPEARPMAQLVEQSVRGSRADIQELKETVRTINNRLHHSANKSRTVFKAHNIPVDEGHLKALTNAQQDLAALPQQIDRAVSASSTLALVEGRYWRLVPHSLVHGLKIDGITADRDVEVTTRLTRTPLKTTRASVDEEAIKQIDAFSEALAREIKTTMDQSSSLETLQHAHNLICKLYEDGIVKTTTADSIQRTAMYQKLQGARVLMKTIFKLRKTSLASQKPKSDYDPADDLEFVPPPTSNLEEQAVAEKA
jgi:hypothetical protein